MATPSHLEPDARQAVSGTRGAEGRGAGHLLTARRMRPRSERVSLRFGARSPTELLAVLIPGLHEKPHPKRGWRKSTAPSKLRWGLGASWRHPRWERQNPEKRTGHPPRISGVHACWSWRIIGTLRMP